MNFDKTLSEINKKVNIIFFNYLENVNIENIHEKHLIQKTFDLEKEIIKLKINLYLHNKEDQYSKDLKIIQDKMNILKDYNLNILHLSKVNKLNLITLINLIFLPLGIIVGYFGMNFKSMNDGIFLIKNSNFFVFILFVLFIIMFTLIYLYLEKRSVGFITRPNRMRLTSSKK